MSERYHTDLDIVGDLRARILSLELAPGIVLSRNALMQHYRISTTPLRDAFLRLKDDGLVDIRAQARTRVSLIDLHHATQIHFLRSSVEQTIVEDLAQAHDKHLIEQLRYMLDLQRACLDQQDLAGFRQLDLAFHQQLFTASGHDTVYHFIRRESGHIDRIRALHLPMHGKGVQILDDHTAITDALHNHDAPAARAAMRRHLSQSFVIGGTLKEQHPQYFAK
ncbi:GntR family transcriptional regulator [Roseinatronobacter sp. S2]|uniref:GntR family transcriptional regulator n=1 Tax=Roseinatronobacter sp. S2 TaxID=3035471 RepID=UPI00241099A9|nr:GntR family transcriptional regulator [Roseinatronobacter sp. S2]WFE76990.1 GntR family transcriptional regulator [Roseinatronobacter sp. S2]